MGRASRRKRDSKIPTRTLPGRHEVKPVGNLAYYLVAYIDLLGQSSELDKIRRLPTNESEAKSTIEAIKKSAARVYQIRSLFDSFFSDLVNVRPETLARVPPAARESFKRFRTLKVNQIGFSDTFVISNSLYERGE